MRVAGADLPQPYLSAGPAGEQVIDGGALVPTQFERSRLDIDGGEALVFGVEPRTDLALVDLVATPGGLLTVITGLGYAHCLLHAHCTRSRSPRSSSTCRLKEKRSRSAADGARLSSSPRDQSPWMRASVSATAAGSPKGEA